MRRRLAGADDTADRLPIDPFGYWPELASAVSGLGGAHPSTDPGYVFHTDYIALAEGPAFFTLAFSGLQSESGMLLISVNERPDSDISHARQTSIRSLSLRQVMRAQGTARIEFFAEAGRLYAFLGRLDHMTGAESPCASGLGVQAIVRDEALALIAQSKESTASGRPPATLLTSAGAPGLDHPGSQPKTREQLDSPAFAQAAAALAGHAAARDVSWTQVYTLRALEATGAVRPGARGLLLGGAQGSLGACLAARGCAITSARVARGGSARDDGAADFDALSRRADEWGFDFLWTDNLLSRAADFDGAVTLALDSLDMLKPGGIAVLVMPYRASDAPGDANAAEEGVLYRAGLERMAMTIMSRGHNVAQLKHDRARPTVRRGFFRKPGEAETGLYGLLIEAGSEDDLKAL